MKALGSPQKGKEEAAMKALGSLQKHHQPSLSQPGKMRLKEYCDHHPEKQLRLNYEITSNTTNGPFQCTLTITTPLMHPIVVTGDLCKSVKEAEHTAADKALLKLK